MMPADFLLAFTHSDACPESWFSSPSLGLISVQQGPSGLDFIVERRSRQRPVDQGYGRGPTAHLEVPSYCFHQCRVRLPVSDHALEFACWNQRMFGNTITPCFH